jgi:hypothetical protein
MAGSYVQAEVNGESQRIASQSGITALSVVRQAISRGIPHEWHTERGPM